MLSLIRVGYHHDITSLEEIRTTLWIKQESIVVVNSPYK